LHIGVDPDALLTARTRNYKNAPSILFMARIQGGCYEQPRLAHATLE